LKIPFDCTGKDDLLLRLFLCYKNMFLIFRRSAEFAANVLTFSKYADVFISDSSYYTLHCSEKW
jgi:hypothetical protein